MLRCSFPILPAFDFELNRATKDTDENEEHQIGGANQDPIFERVGREASERVGAIDVG